MSLSTALDIILALAFFAYIVYRDRCNHKKVVSYRKPLRKKDKPYKGKFILSCRDYSVLKNDHTADYINACWDEVEKHK